MLKIEAAPDMAEVLTLVKYAKESAQAIKGATSGTTWREAWIVEDACDRILEILNAGGQND